MTTSLSIVSFLAVLAVSFEMPVPAVGLSLLGAVIACHTFN